MQKPANVVRDVFLVILAGCGGAFDAATFLRFHTFTANMTGNTVLFGLSASARNMPSLAHTGLAIAAFVAGSFAGALLGRKADPHDVWPARLTLAFAVEVLLIAVVAVAWHDAASAAGADAIIAVACAAMGLQSAITSELHGAGASSTYMTGTLARVGTSLAQSMRMGYQGGFGLNAGSWIVYVGAVLAVGSYAADRHALDPVFWVLAVIIAAVALAGRVLVTRTLRRSGASA